ncbi:hypothetical protein [Rubricoccus marinus]|uniref:Uncharacterized protein n=1 Tax=Rubricoccus marinus TaxID=716817 RepID=A0A259TY70_9BACT|nr:hypothetical protein [Rubricoccus marinus]OZC02699.1 hypothetical protein BSZ36_06750 [Rubricoccus marinus]
MALVGGEIGVGDGPPALTVLYAASRRLSPDAEQLLARQAALALGVPPEAARTRSVRLGTRAVPADSSSAARFASDLGTLVGRYASLRLVVRADSASGARLRQGLVRAGAPDAQVSVRRDSVPARITLRLAN